MSARVLSQDIEYRWIEAAVLNRCGGVSRWEAIFRAQIVFAVRNTRKQTFGATGSDRNCAAMATRN